MMEIWRRASLHNNIKQSDILQSNNEEKDNEGNDNQTVN